MSSSTSKNYNSQPAPSGHPDVPIEMERAGQQRTTEKGKRKQVLIDLGDQLGRDIFKMLVTDPKFKTHSIDMQEIGVLVDFMYAAIFDEIYTARIPGHQPTKAGVTGGNPKK